MHATCKGFELIICIIFTSFYNPTPTISRWRNVNFKCIQVCTTLTKGTKLLFFIEQKKPQMIQPQRWYNGTVDGKVPLQDSNHVCKSYHHMIDDIFPSVDHHWGIASRLQCSADDRTTAPCLSPERLFSPSLSSQDGGGESGQALRTSLAHCSGTPRTVSISCFGVSSCKSCYLVIGIEPSSFQLQFKHYGRCSQSSNTGGYNPLL